MPAPTTSSPRSTAPIQSLQRAAAILRSFSEAEPELSVTELSQRLGLHKSTVSRILATLLLERLVGRNPESGKYGLGLGLVSLGGIALGRLDVRALALPYLSPLVELTEETVIVTVLEGRECVNIARTSSPKPIQFVGWIGRRTPIHCTASGKVFLAHMDANARSALLSSALQHYTDQTIIDADIMEQSLIEIRNQGYAIVHGEFEEGFSNIAAPIFDHLDQVTACIAISGPTFRMGPGQIEAFAEPLLETANAISTQLGYTAQTNRMSVRMVSCQASNADPAVQAILEYLDTQLDISLDLAHNLSWQHRLRAFKNGDIEIAWICGSYYVDLMKFQPSQFRLLVAPVMQGKRYQNKPVYFSDIIVRTDSLFHSFSDLRNKSWAYNEPGSYFRTIDHTLSSCPIGAHARFLWRLHRIRLSSNVAANGSCWKNRRNDHRQHGAGGRITLDTPNWVKKSG